MGDNGLFGMLFSKEELEKTSPLPSSQRLSLLDLHFRYPRLREFEKRLALSLEVEGDYPDSPEVVKKEELLEGLSRNIIVKFQNSAVLIREKGDLVETKRAFVLPSSCLKKVVSSYPEDSFPFPVALRLFELALLFCLERHYGEGGVRLLLSFRDIIIRTKVVPKKK